MSPVCLAATPTGSEATYQLVQSVPKGTHLALPGLTRTQDAWLSMLGNARQRIDIAAFYISNRAGEPLQPVLDLLRRRARDGVKVRLLLDKTFMAQTRPSLGQLEGIPNISIRILPMDTLTGGVLHAKFMVIDQREVFVGSQNLDWRSIDQIHELGVRMQDRRLAQTYAAVFQTLWRTAGLDTGARVSSTRPGPARGFRPVTAADPVTLRGADGQPVTAWPAFSPPALTPSGLDTEQTQLLRLIGAARHALRIQVMTLSALPEFGPRHYWPALDNALREASVRGVKVRIIVADWALQEPMQSYLKSLTVLPGIEVRFSRLPPAPRGFIAYARVEHCKYAIADDDLVYIGTGNWGWSYFNASVDSSVFMRGASPAAVIGRIFDNDWTGPYTHPLQPDRTYTPPRLH